MVDCNTCKHNFVCKYKEEYIRVRDKSNSEEFKGIFDICCNEYLECEYVEFKDNTITSIKENPYLLGEDRLVFKGELRY